MSALYWYLAFYALIGIALWFGYKALREVACLVGILHCANNSPRNEA